MKHPAAPCPARYKHTTCGVVVEASLAGRRAGLAMSAWRVPQGRKRHHRLAKASVARSDLRRGIVPLTICDGLGSMPKCFACGNPSEIQESSDSCFSA